METIKEVKTTTKINATKGEFVNLVNGLFAVQDLKGKKFGLVVSKNIATIQEALQDLADAGKPSPEFLKLAEEVNAIAEKNEEDAKDQIKKLEEDNQELVDARRKQMKDLEETMKETIDIELNVISESLLPESVTAKQITALIKIID
tara:strand:- start:430 stop:870 length:441 start_codon:yes stop_codon:yes gene_type:complete